METKMKKILAGILAVACIGVVAMPLGMLNASAGEQKTVFLDEDFESDQLSKSKWTVNSPENNIALSSIEDTMHITSDQNVEKYLLGFENKLSDLEYLQFDTIFEEKLFKAIYFTKDVITDYPLHPTHGVFSYDVVWEPEIVFNADEGGKVSALTWGGISGEKGLDVDVNVWNTVRLEKTSATTATLYVGAQGTDVKATGEAIELSIKSNSDFTFDDAHIYIGSSGGTLAIDNFQIKAKDLEIDEKFNDDNIDPKIKEYKLNEKIPSYTIVRANSYLAFENASTGDNMVYNSPIHKEESIIESVNCLNAEFNVKVGGKLSDDSIAFVFGVGADKQYANGCYQVRISSKGVSIYSVFDGVETELHETVAVKKLESKNGANLTIIANKDGMVSVWENNKVIVEVSVDKEDYYVGYLGFAALQDNTGIVEIDDLKISTVKYKIPVSKSVSHNFSGDYFGNEGYEDFVMKEAQTNALYVEDGKLVLNGQSDEGYFGSAYEYDDFVLDYKICNIYTRGITGDREATQNGHWFGLDIGRQHATEGEYGTNLNIFFYIARPQNTETNDEWNYSGIGLYSKNPNVDKNKIVEDWVEHEKIPASYFKNIQYDGTTKVESDVLDKDAVCVRWVAQKGSLRLYMKRACDIEYTLYYTFNGIETTGYQALVCTGFAYLKIDDFTMSNISDIYVNADTYIPEEIVTPGQTITIVDRGQADMNGLKETEMNSGNGCGSQIHAGYALVPMAVAAGFVLVKKDKSRDKE